MIHKQRLIKALSFDNPDKLPVYYHASPSGLFKHGQKLLDLFKKYPPDNYIVFDKLPSLPSGSINDDKKYHEIKTDEWQVQWEYRIFGIQGYPLHSPLANWSAFNGFNFPQLPEFNEDLISEIKEDYLVKLDYGISLFERVQALRGFENTLIDVFTQDSNFIKLTDMLVDWHSQLISKAIRSGIEWFVFGDDWGTQNGLLISPEIFREFYKPRIAKLIEQIHNSNRYVIYHSCGKVEQLFDDLVECGIDGFWHQIGLYDMEAFAKKAFDANVMLYLHMDRQTLIPKGTPEDIRRTVKKYAKLHKSLGGGAMFYIEIENDAPFENVVTLIESVNEYR